MSKRVRGTGQSPARGTELATASVARVISAVAAAWVMSLGVDLLLHGALLARLYAKASPFLLGREEAFRRIPLGYLAFLILTLSLYWLLSLRFKPVACGGAVGRGSW
jgi:hypothetical protein